MSSSGVLPSRKSAEEELAEESRRVNLKASAECADKSSKQGFAGWMEILHRTGETRPGSSLRTKAEGPMKQTSRNGIQLFLPCLLWGICAAGIGCGGPPSCPREAPIPRELRMTNLPPYRIEPPDILLITTLRVVPKPPYHVEPMDALAVQVTGTVKEKEIWGLYPIEPNGTINLGLGYGTVQVSGMTIEEAQKAVLDHLSKILTEPTVQVSLGQARGMQQITGPHLVRQDGTVNMGLYGSVYVTDMTLEDARKTIEDHLSKYVLKPQISLDVYIYNSKWYYIIMDRAGYGQTIFRLPITGRETVLDALSNAFGTTFFGSNRYLWLARPNGQDPSKYQMFPINLQAIVKGGSPETNYQLLPGDRLFVQSNPLIKANTRISQAWAPIMGFFNNAMGLTLLGNSAVSAIEGTALEFKNSASSVLTPGVGTVGVLR